MGSVLLSIKMDGQHGFQLVRPNTGQYPLWKTKSNESLPIPLDGWFGVYLELIWPYPR